MKCIISKCPVCGSNNYHNVQVRIEETKKNLSLKDVNEIYIKI
ncbi:hypothetical protein MSSAC_1206 [Methanosarcina siciliae C2J]|uniref:Uncharacterized protein n=1 Tax=Methanosarcina siciliae C2J TaxID=1434118 RepID=A0A0E3LCM8_9EURY|nr:hypothetical protein MSSAC_1206 [Methanosarcina siciliae C2J]